MKDDKWKTVKYLKWNTAIDLLLSLSESFFGLILIFGLGFVFPDVNPYSAIKWIVIVCAVVFVYSLVSFMVMGFKVSRAKILMSDGAKKISGKKSSKK